MFGAAKSDVNKRQEAMSTIADALGEGLRAVRRTAWDLLLPPICCLCGARGFRSGLDLCEVCAALLPVAPECVAPPGIDSVLALFRYAYPVDNMVRALKFRGERIYGRVFGELIGEACGIATSELPDLLVPIPLHPARYRKRGFNQAEDIARFAGARLRVPMHATLLVRSTPTREQSGLSPHARRRNVRGAFRALRSAAACRIALVDDVLTTGSTAAEAARVLREAGAAEIRLWTPACVAPH